MAGLNCGHIWLPVLGVMDHWTLCFEVELLGKDELPACDIVFRPNEPRVVGSPDTCMAMLLRACQKYVDDVIGPYMVSHGIKDDEAGICINTRQWIGKSDTTTGLNLPKRCVALRLRLPKISLPPWDTEMEFHPVYINDVSGFTYAFARYLNGHMDE